MLTLKHFEKLVHSYGGDLGRWPEETRREAARLLQALPEARALIDEARELDEVIEAATAREHAAHWPAGEQAAALSRLRSRVRQRIGERAGVESDPERRPRVNPRSLWESRILQITVTPGRFAVLAGVAALAGLLIGATSFVTAPSSDNFLTVLQPEPIHLAE